MKRQITRVLLLETIQVHILALYSIVDNLLDDTEFNRKTKDQILLTKELLKKSILDQPRYQNEPSLKKNGELNHHDL